MSTTANNNKERRSNITGKLNEVADKALLVSSFFWGCASVTSWVDYRFASSSLEKIRKAKTVPISDLRSLLHDDSQSSSPDDNLVIVRGFIQALRTTGRSVTLDAFHRSGESFKGVVVQDEGWFRDTIKTTVPFVLGKTSSSRDGDGDYVTVNLHFSNHPLPLLTKVYDHYVPVRGLGSPFLERVQGKILELGREVSAVGRIYCRSDEDRFRIRACDDLPFFLSDMTKDEMVEHLADKTDALFWAAVFCGSLSLGLLGYLYWRHRKQQIIKTKQQIMGTLVGWINAAITQNKSDLDE